MDNRRGSRCPRFEVVGRDLQADVSIVKVGLTEQTPGGRERRGLTKQISGKSLSGASSQEASMTGTAWSGCGHGGS